MLARKCASAPCKNPSFIMTQYQLIQSDIDKIKSFEGFRSEAYKPVPNEKYYTIGYGHYGADVRFGMKITKQQGEELLVKDIAKFQSYVNNLGVCKTYPQFAALVDFAFNLGTNALRTSTLLKKIKSGASENEIRYQFSRWVYSNGQKLPGLVKRRAWEANRYFDKES